MSRCLLRCQRKEIKESMNNWVNETMNQWVDESMSQWVEESMNRWRNETINQWIRRWINQSIDEPRNQWINEAMKQWNHESKSGWSSKSMNQWVSEAMQQWIIDPCKESMNQRISKSINQWSTESRNHWFNEPRILMNQWINETTNRWINESVNQWIYESMNLWIKKQLPDVLKASLGATKIRVTNRGKWKNHSENVKRVSICDLGIWTLNVLNKVLNLRRRFIWTTKLLVVWLNIFFHMKYCTCVFFWLGDGSFNALNLKFFGWWRWDHCEGRYGKGWWLQCTCCDDHCDDLTIGWTVGWIRKHDAFQVSRAKPVSAFALVQGIGLFFVLFLVVAVLKPT